VIPFQKRGKGSPTKARGGVATTRAQAKASEEMAVLDSDESIFDDFDEGVDEDEAEAELRHQQEREAEDQAILDGFHAGPAAQPHLASSKRTTAGESQYARFRARLQNSHQSFLRCRQRYRQSTSTRIVSNTMRYFSFIYRINGLIISEDLETIARIVEDVIRTRGRPARVVLQCSLVLADDSGNMRFYPASSNTQFFNRIFRNHKSVKPTINSLTMHGIYEELMARIDSDSDWVLIGIAAVRVMVSFLK